MTIECDLMLVLGICSIYQAFVTEMIKLLSNSTNSPPSERFHLEGNETSMPGIPIVTNHAFESASFLSKRWKNHPCVTDDGFSMISKQIKPLKWKFSIYFVNKDLLFRYYDLSFFLNLNLTHLGFRLFVCLFIWGVKSHSRIFHLYWDDTITAEGLQILTYAHGRHWAVRVL